MKKQGTERGKKQANVQVTVKGSIMKKSLLAIAAVVAAAGAFAGEADPSGQFALQIEGQRTRAEVNAEAVAAVQSGATAPSSIPASSKVQPQVKSGLDARIVRAQAAEAVRLGQISYGEGRI
jgi:hypothetical protein